LAKRKIKDPLKGQFASLPTAIGALRTLGPTVPPPPYACDIFLGLLVYLEDGSNMFPETSVNIYRNTWSLIKQ
jgi:hypothetical protein